MKRRQGVLAALLAMSLVLSGPIEVFAQENIDSVQKQEVALDEETNLQTESSIIENEEIEEETEEIETVNEILPESQETVCLDPEEPEEDSALVEEEPEMDLDPGQWRLTGDIPEGFKDAGMQARAVSAVTHNPKFRGMEIQKGIDVSKWNGNIDWAQVKQAGIQFAIVRTSYRTYSRDSKYAGVKGLNTDPTYKTNIENALKNGIPVGVYIFSQATSVAEAQQEANYILQTIKGYNITLPVVMDYEYAGGSSGKLQYWKNKSKPSRTTMTNICMAFCQVIENAGYVPMVYANKSMLTNDLNAGTISARYPVWLAHYTTSTNYAGDYQYWQYSESGRVSGCTGNNGYVDVNYRYVPLNMTATPTSTSSIALKWKAVTDADGYTVERLGENGQYTVLTHTEGTSYQDVNLLAGTSYSYRVRPYKVIQHETDDTLIESEVDGTENPVDKDYDVFGQEVSARAVAATMLPSFTMAGGSAQGFDSVSLKWNGLKDATGYQIQRYDSGKKSYVTVKTVGGASTYSTVVSGDMNSNSSYTFRVRAYKSVSNATAYSDYTKEISVRTAGVGSGKTKSKNLILRKSASTSSKNLGRIKKKSTKLSVLGSSGSWYKVKVKIGGKTKTGYLLKSRVSVTNKGTSSGNTSVSTGKRTNTAGLILRKSASSRSKKVVKISKKGTAVSVLKTVGSWAKISVKINGKKYTGYILKKRIS